MDIVKGLPLWAWVVGLFVGGVLFMRAAGITMGQAGATAYDFMVQGASPSTPSIVPLLVIVAPFIVVGFVVVGAFYLLHDHAKAKVLFIGAIAVAVAALVWHMGAGDWILTHWLTRPA